MISRSLIAVIGFALFSVIPIEPLQQSWARFMAGLSPDRALTRAGQDPGYVRHFPEDGPHFSGAVVFRVNPRCTMLNVAAAMIGFIGTWRRPGRMVWQGLAVVALVSAVNGLRLLMMDALHTQGLSHVVAHDVPHWIIAGTLMIGAYAWRARNPAQPYLTDHTRVATDVPA